MLINLENQFFITRAPFINRFVGIWSNPVTQKIFHVVSTAFINSINVPFGYFSKQDCVISEWVSKNILEHFLNNILELLLQVVCVERNTIWKKAITAQWVLKRQWIPVNLYRRRQRNKPKIKKLLQHNKTQNKKATMKLDDITIKILTEHSMSQMLTSKLVGK